MEKTARTYSVRAFGVAREIMGGAKISIETDAGTAGALRTYLKSSYPELGTLRSFFIAVNNEYASDDIALHQGDEIAVIPPVSGG